MAFNNYKQLELNKISSDILTFWEKEKIFDKSISLNKDSTPYIFYEGPPSANGLPESIMLWQEPLKIYFAGIKRKKGSKSKEKLDGILTGYP